MAMSTSTRKVALAAHLTFAVGWIGAAIAYLVLGVAAEASDDPETVRSAWVAMELIGWYVIVPLAVASLVTGVVMALGTRWGLFRHYWVLISLVLTAFATIVLVLHMPSVTSNADAARDADATHLAVMGGDVEHPAIGIVVLVVVLVLNLHKPKGLTRYGRRRQQNERRARTDQETTLVPS